MRPQSTFAPVLIAALSGVLAAANHAASAPAPDRDLDRLAGWMTGAFSSAAQAARDTNFLDIRLRIAPIWRERTDARWFYVEQASASRLDGPYRQRVYRLARLADGRFESAVHTLPEPQRFAGAFRGGTEGTGCASDLRGADHATSEVRIERRRMVTLDRGWDGAGKQSWGSEHGGYEFVKERAK